MKTNPLILLGAYLAFTSALRAQSESTSPDGQFTLKWHDLPTRTEMDISGSAINGSQIIWLGAYGINDGTEHKREIVDSIAWAPKKNQPGDTLFALATDIIRYKGTNQPDGLFVFSSETGGVALKD